MPEIRSKLKNDESPNGVPYYQSVPRNHYSVVKKKVEIVKQPPTRTCDLHYGDFMIAQFIKKKLNHFILLRPFKTLEPMN